uniref:DUF5679 domain-containing protein n=1 Tax=Streptomyces sp. NBC_00180 TaxID=2903632 RepID=A0AAU1I338_9ACTN
MTVQLMHFQCPKCQPRLVVGTTPAICGATVQGLTRGQPVSKCPACKEQLGDHKRSHRR